MVALSKQQQRLAYLIGRSAATIASLAEDTASIARIGDAVVGALRAGHKVLTAGNGGSAAEALHMAEELSGRYRADRVALPGLSLTADPTALTCIGNDFGFDRVFSRQVEALGQTGDVLVLFSTSGRAANLTLALEAARARGVIVIGFLGRDGGALAGRCDFDYIVRSDETERIQEAHQVLLHLVLESVEDAFSETVNAGVNLQ